MMNKETDILAELGKSRAGHSVPEGYFDKLQERLSAIPAQHPARRRIPYVLPAAIGAAAAMVVGAFLMTRGSSSDGIEEIISYEQYASADLIPHTDPYIYFADDIKQTSRLSEEEIAEYIEYLIEH